ncbi:hypothetical protein EDC04DRAFT_3122943 [Pisolithus marmoratus]|nr:hypothetical protein EDC04DRAFT_3122943 [Pisolithus marmoratus]
MKITHRQPPYRGPTSHSRPQTPHRYSHDRSRSVAGHRPVTPSRHYHGHHDLYHSEKYGNPMSPDELDYESTPEDIKILPPDPNAKPQRVTGSYSARPRRSSEPYRAHPQSPRARDSDVYDTPPLRHLSTTLNVPAVTYSHSQRIQDPYDHHHLGRSHSRGNRPHAPIVHAPGHNRNTDHYAPPRKPPGIGHIVPSPTGPQYPRIANVPHPRAHSYRGPVLEEQRHGPKGPRDIPRSHTPVSEAVSGETGNTYYILPPAGQKMKVLAGPEPSLYNGSESTKSASMPRTPNSIVGRGLRRILHFASDFSKAPWPSRPRSHSVDVSRRSQSRDRR